MKAIAYYRVSTDIQELNSQQTSAIKYCKDNNIQLVKEFSEKISGKLKMKDRPELSEMLLYAKNNSIDCIIVNELSRLGRTHEVLSIIEGLTAYKVCLIALNPFIIQTLNPDKTENLNAKMVTGFISSINGFELDTFKSRSKRGIRQSRINGNAAGSLNIPYGYKKEGKKLVIDTEEKVIIEKIFQLCIDGNGTKKIANWLNENNIGTRSQKIVPMLEIRKKEIEKEENKTEKQIEKLNKLNKQIEKFKNTNWVDGTVFTILKNDIYIGKRKHIQENGKNYEYFDQPQLRILTNETFEKAQKALTGKGTKTPFVKFNYLLDRQKIICGVCGKTYFPHKRTNGKDNRYMCLSKRYNTECSNVGISIDKINKLVNKVIISKMPEILLKNMEDNNLKKEIEHYSNEIKLLTNELKKENNKESKLLDIYLNDNDNLLDKKVYEQKQKAIRQAKETIQNKINILVIQKEKAKNDLDKITNIQNIQAANWEGKDLPKAIVNNIISKIIITKFSEPITEEKYKVFTVKKDILIYVKIVCGISEFDYIISQREHNYIFDVSTNSFDLYLAH